MKKAIFCLVIILTFGHANGQVSVGIAAGGNFSKINQSIDYGNNPDIVEPDKRDLKPTLGFSFGIPIEISFTEKLSLFTLPGYLQKGSGVELVYQGTENTVDKVKGYTKYNYLEMPVVIQYHFAKQSFGLYAGTGPSFGYLLNASTKHKITTVNTADNSSETETIEEKISSDDIKEMNANRFDISLSVGIGCDYNAGKGKFFLNVNYLYGFSNMMKGSEFPYIGVKQFNRGVSVMAGYMISFSK